jgi:UDP-GlcNAc3NAcA epimerase
MKVMTIVGARPQFIKAAPVSRALRKRRGATEVLVHTGQHYDDNMSEVFFRELDIAPPDRHLGIGSSAHGDQTGRMLIAVEATIAHVRPDWVLVYGDTNTTLAGALAAAKLRVPVAHVEAGLRSFNRDMPEEVNRVVADHIADLLFAPTSAAVDNLRREGIARSRIVRTGDVMYDAALYYGAKAERASRILDDLTLSPRQYVLVTIHRAENTDNRDRLKAILRALEKLSRTITVVLPLHPRTRAAMQQAGLGSDTKIKMIDAVGYLDMVVLERNACLIATDSGGVQKEAYFYRVPCATLRTETEWVELVRAGWNRIVAPDSPERIFRVLHAMLARFRPPRAGRSLYGDGHAAEAIVKRLLDA